MFASTGAVITRPGTPEDSRIDRALSPSDRPESGGRPATSQTARRLPKLTIEHLCWAVLILLAIVTRFWDLGSRAMMHDETIHTYYSWLLYDGRGYIHDPLSHGPFLFHANALVYFLFGDSDATSRYMPALFGVILVALPWFLRGPRHLGRWGALAASTGFLLSPALLYYTRFIRHDPYTVVGTLALVIAIFRYMEKPERRWLILGGAMLGFLYTNHEIVFAIVALFAAFLGGALLWGRLRPILPVGIAAVAVGLAIVLMYRALEFGGPLPEIPWDRSGNEAPMPTTENQRQFYIDLLTHPFILSLIGVVMLFFVGCWYIIRDLTLPEAEEVDASGRRRGWMDVLFADSRPGTIEAAFRNAWHDKLGLQLALLLALVICVTLFTTFFTNLGGLATGTIATDGTLLYWLGQHDVQRGEQPWFYFLLLAPQYEFFAIAFGIPAVVLAAWRLVRSFRGEREWNPRLTFTLFLSFWAIGITAGLSYAGEKMPWLVVHITLPLILLAATLVDEIVSRAIAARNAAALDPSPRPRPAWVSPTLVAALLTLGGGWLVKAADFSHPVFIQDVEGTWQRVVDTAVADRWWQLAVPPAVCVAFIAFAWWLIGGARTGRTTVFALTVGLLLLQMHAGFRLSFQEGDVARDSLIYNTTTPDITNMMGDIEELSYLMTGGLDLEVQFGDHVNWPLYWYLRNFPNAFYSNKVEAGTNVPIIILSYSEASQYRAQLTNYTEQEYVLRWHEPEDEIYRNFAIAPELPPHRSAWGDEDNPHGPLAIIESILSSLNTQTTPEGQQRLWRLIMYREMPEGTINWGYSVFIRNDLLPTYNAIRYDT